MVVPGDFGWDDVGTWAALERIYDKDENGNVIKGEAVAIEAGGNIIDNSLGDKLVVAFGVKDLVIVNSEDVVLVAYNFFSEDPLVWLVATFTALVFVLILVGVGPKGCKIIAVVLKRPGASLGILGEILNYTKWVALSGIAYIVMPYLARFILAVLYALS